MKAIAINGSPRKNRSTHILLQRALEGVESVGADTELVHLYDLNFRGCTSCFACKRKGSKNIGRCAMKDDLTIVLEKITECDVLLLGSPMYCGDITGEMHSFLERLLFSNMTYNTGNGSIFKGKVSSGFIYTMNYSEEALRYYTNYETLFHNYKHFLGLLKGPSEYILSTDTYQFDDYSKYEASMFDVNHKNKVRKKQFPVECKNAYELGEWLANTRLRL